MTASGRRHAPHAAMASRFNLVRQMWLENKCGLRKLVSIVIATHGLALFTSPWISALQGADMSSGTRARERDENGGRNSNMYRAVTRNIEVVVTPRFVADRSSPENNYFFWAYTISITNNGSRNGAIENPALAHHRCPRPPPGSARRRRRRRGTGAQVRRIVRIYQRGAATDAFRLHGRQLRDGERVPASTSISRCRLSRSTASKASAPSTRSSRTRSSRLGFHSPAFGTQSSRSTRPPTRSARTRWDLSPSRARTKGQQPPRQGKSCPSAVSRFNRILTKSPKPVPVPDPEPVGPRQAHFAAMQ